MSYLRFLIHKREQMCYMVRCKTTPCETSCGGVARAPQIMGEVGIERSRWDCPRYEISSQSDDPNLLICPPQRVLTVFYLKRISHSIQLSRPLDRCEPHGICDIWAFLFFGLLWENREKGRRRGGGLWCLDGPFGLIIRWAPLDVSLGIAMWDVCTGALAIYLIYGTYALVHLSCMESPCKISCEAHLMINPSGPSKPSSYMSWISWGLHWFEWTEPLDWVWIGREFY